MTIYKCEFCGRIIDELTAGAGTLVCCDHPMQKLEPGTSDGAVEKHVPVFEIAGNKVSVVVGSVEHPMVDEHYIEWIAIETTTGIQRKYLKPSEAPKAEFVLADGESVIEVYAYCNLHGLWRA